MISHRTKSALLIPLCAMILGHLALPPSLLSWCWLRDTGRTSTGCTSSTQFKQTCCSGNLRVWTGANMDYHIMSSTSAALNARIQQGVATWNDVAMSTFTFTYQGTSTANNLGRDNINLIGIDPAFTTNNPDFSGQNILAISTSWPVGKNTPSYQAVESDIIFNGEEYTWSDGTNTGMDTVGVVTHEAGHSAGLGHAGAACQNQGSEGCGPNFAAATMYWNYSGGQPTTKSSLELDDVAALVHGYPRSTFRVRVVNSSSGGVPGATVTLLDAAAPVDGTSIAEGGKVLGDVTNPSVLMGNKAFSSSYVYQTPFTKTDSSGYTNNIYPTHRNIRLTATIGAITRTVSHTLVDGTTTLDISLPGDLSDLSPPSLSITSHTTNSYVPDPSITLSGTASDSGQGDHGVLSVTVNGNATTNGTATGSGVANWSHDMTLSEGSNLISVVAKDDTDVQNPITKSITLKYDTTAPSVSTTTPSSGAANVVSNATVNALFTETLKASTVTATSFTLTTSGGAAVSGTVTYNDDTRTATLTPSSALTVGTTYTATLTTAIQDKAGNAMAENHAWNFSVASSSGSGGGGGGGGCFVQSLP